MRWLTLTYIKAHSRIDFTTDDDLLTLYGDAAEDMVLNVCNRSYENVINEWGEVPKPLYQAALMLVEVSYTQRSPVSQQNMYNVAYTFDFLVKPYMKLTVGNENENENENENRCKWS